MALPAIPARFIDLDLPLAPEDSFRAVQGRLLESLRKRQFQRGLPVPLETDNLSDDDDCDLLQLDLDAKPQAYDAFSRSRHWAKIYMQARERATASIAHLKTHERELLQRAARNSRAHGVLTRDQVDERIASVHAEFPWMAPASTFVMNRLRLTSSKGSAPAHLPPIIVLGPPGIAKSSWARALAQAFELPAAEIDIGATNGATFAISGVERGWGSAAPGRVVTTMLREQVANPLVIIDEIDKIPTSVGTSHGSLPGAFEVLKSMIEPATARAWTCPYHQIPFDLSRVSWIMTTNSIDQIPAAFLDRCRVIRIEGPDHAQLKAIAEARLRQLGGGEDAEVLLKGITRLIDASRRRGARMSLRGLMRLIEDVASYSDRPRLN